MSNRILIATGGTGGHIYPAIALAQQLMRQVPDCEVMFIGGNLANNPYFDKQSFSHHTISCGSFVKTDPAALIKSSTNIMRGIFQSHRFIKQYNPAVIVGFGSFYTFPSLIAAKLLSVPIVLHEANSVPGKVNRIMSPMATVTGVNFPGTAELLKGNIVEVGIPLRSGFTLDHTTKAEARARFNLDPNLTTLLVFGGSQGAKFINQCIQQALMLLPSSDILQVLHIAGADEKLQNLRNFYSELGIRACVRAYENRMEDAWQAADLVVSRSGAGTIAEQLEFEVPGILIPFPLAADNHQEKNADFMTALVGGAVKLHEPGLTGKRLGECIIEFLRREGEMIKRMTQSMKNYKKRAREKDLCTIIREIIKE